MEFGSGGYTGTVEASHSRPRWKGWGALKSDLKRDFVPAMKTFGLAGAGYVSAEYGARTLLPGVSPLWQAVVQSATGLVGMVVTRKLGWTYMETVALGAGVSGAVKGLTHILGKLTEVK